MSSPLPTVTIIIPTKPDLREIAALEAARVVDYPHEKLEIIIARGKQPSVQRNSAIKAARGDLIYFLDDDSVVQKENILRAAEHFRDAQVQMVGGPNLCPEDAPMLEKVFALVLSSWIAFGPSRARYSRVGDVRPTGEKELILCNLMSRRQPLLELGGFNEALYPNEENALMDELQKRGGKLLYDPQFFVYRRPRRNLRAFSRMLFNYGRGRAEQFRVHPTMGSAMNFVPPLFCVYLLALPFLCLISCVAALPLVFFAVALLAQAAALLKHGGLVKSICAIPLMALTHFLYGAGFWRGLFTTLKPPGQPSTVPVSLETIRL